MRYSNIEKKIVKFSLVFSAFSLLLCFVAGILWFVDLEFGVGIKAAIAGTEAPTVTISSPTDVAYSTNFASVDVSGTATDNVAITSISWSNNRGGSGVPVGVYVWNAAGIALQPGENVISVTAQDAAGNSTTDSITVIYTPLTADNANASGFMWSSNIGWISLHYKNCDTDENGFVDLNLECGGDNSSTVVSAYGVNISNSSSHFGDLSGYAWSPNVGWISFQENNPPNFTFSAKCEQSDTCNGPEDSCTACYNRTDGKVYGWAKILSLGDDGWIKLNKDAFDGGPDYGINIDADGVMSGLGWNGSTENGRGVGWISTNCSDYLSCDGGVNYLENCANDSDCPGASCVDTCTLVDYSSRAKINNPPLVRFVNMTDPGHCDYRCACGILGPLNPQLIWVFSDVDVGDFQAKYQLIFDDSNHAVGDLDAIVDGVGNSLPLKTPEINGSVISFYPATNTYRNVQIEYDTEYFAWIKVWDNNGGDSGWVSLDLTGADLSFRTYVHGFPKIDPITWDPENPSADEPVQFYDHSKIYEMGNPDLAVPCNNDSSLCLWEWEFPLDATSADLTTSTPVVLFGAKGTPIIKLKVTNNDASAYYCEKVFNNLVDINVRLPDWIETKD